MISKIVKHFSPSLLTSPLTFAMSQCPNGYLSFRLQSYEEGQRLDRYLKGTPIGWISAQKHLRNGNIKVMAADGTMTTRNNHRFTTGDQLLIKEGLGLQTLLLGDKNPKHIQLDFTKTKQILDSMTVFDNQNLTIVNKPVGFSVQGGNDPYHNMFSLMVARYKKQMVYISHRLDKPTSGLVLLPKNIRTAQLLGKALQSREGIEKYYMALTEGRQINPKQGKISCHLQWVNNKHRARITEEVSGNDRSDYSQTLYYQLSQKKLSDILYRNLLGLKLLTGRKHQLRCHLSEYLLNPIFNDTLYRGISHKQSNSDAIYLHSFGLKINQKQIIREVFKFSNKDNSLQNPNGLIEHIQGQLSVFASPPSFWHQQQNIQLSLQTMKQAIVRLDALGRSSSRSKTPSKII